VNEDAYVVLLCVLKKFKNNGEFFDSTSWKEEQEADAGGGTG